MSPEETTSGLLGSFFSTAAVAARPRNQSWRKMYEPLAWTAKAEISDWVGRNRGCSAPSSTIFFHALTCSGE